jgi:DNA-binding winged helix-turn-helix (wHTH) protein/Tol biopolymer transport system component
MPQTSKEQASEFQNGTRTIRFGEFEVDLHMGEVRRSGLRLKLQEQPFKILQVLLERPGELVTRDELRSRIWPDETYGDFDHAVNVAIGKLRTALGDSADAPHYVETVPRRGYRFVAHLDSVPSLPMAVAHPPAAKEQTGRRREIGKWALFTTVAAIVAAALLALGVVVGRRTAQPRTAEFQRLTARRGTVYTARFAPDGHTVVFTAAWDGGPLEVYESDLNFGGTRSVGLSGSGLLAVSSTGELAVAQSAMNRFMLNLQGTLGEVPLTGGSPRPIAEDVEWADWTPDGKNLAVVRHIRGMERLEFPVGHVLYQTAGWISHPRISPAGDTIAFLDHPTDMDDRGMVSLIDRSGKKRDLSQGWESEEGLAWSPGGKEIWFSAARAGLQRRIYAVDLAGKLQLHYSAPGGVTLEDIAPDGRLLLTRDELRAGMLGRAAGATQEKNLSWLDWSLPTDLSPDGKFVLFDEQGEQGGPDYTVAIRDLQGSPPEPLGEGMAGGFSPDGKWVSATVDYNRIVLLPTGAGSPRHIDPGGIQQYGHPVRWLPDGKRLLFNGREPGRESRCFVQSIDGGKPRPVTPEGVVGCHVSPDGKWIAAEDVTDKVGRLYPVDGGSPRDIPGLLPGEGFGWGADPKYLYVTDGKDAPLKIYQLDLATGKRELFRELNPSDMTGICELSNILLSHDGRSYVYGFTRLLSDLYLVKGLN